MPLPRTRIKFGDTPPDWAAALPLFSLGIAVLSPLFFLVAMIGHANPGRYFDVANHPALAAITYAGIAVQVLFFIYCALILWQRRAVGLGLLVVGFTYEAMALNALLIAGLVLGSWLLFAVTLALLIWSVMGLLSVNRSVPDGAIPPLAAAIIRDEDGAQILSSASVEIAQLQSEMLAGKRSGLATLIEYAGVFVMVLLGPGLLPFAIVGDLDQTGFVGWVIWGIAMVICLAARGQANRQWLQYRAMQYAQNAA